MDRQTSFPPVPTPQEWPKDGGWDVLVEDLPKSQPKEAKEAPITSDTLFFTPLCHREGSAEQVTPTRSWPVGPS